MARAHIDLLGSRISLVVRIKRSEISDKCRRLDHVGLARSTTAMSFRLQPLDIRDSTSSVIFPRDGRSAGFSSVGT